MHIGFIGCGFASDYYFKSLLAYPQLKLLGVTDRDQNRASKFSAYYSVPLFHSLEELLENKNIDTIVNLTNPDNHFSVSKACLKAGKHVYSEKPLAMKLSEAKELIDLAQKQNLYISSAPCTILSETAQTIWKVLRKNTIGRVRLVYAELDYGPIYQLSYKKWINKSGTPWPYKDEFKVGCTLEHASYYISWLTAFFGPAKTITAFSSCLVPEKITNLPSTFKTPDFSVACITFVSGIVARLTCSIIASRNRSLQIFADNGVLCCDDGRNYQSPVYIKPLTATASKLKFFPQKQYCPLLKIKNFNLRYNKELTGDFCRGIAELASAINEKRPCRLSPQYSLHITEIMLAIQNALDTGHTYNVSSSFDPIAPMTWAMP